MRAAGSPAPWEPQETEEESEEELRKEVTVEGDGGKGEGPRGRTSACWEHRGRTTAPGTATSSAGRGCTGAGDDRSGRKDSPSSVLTADRYANAHEALVGRDRVETIEYGKDGRYITNSAEIARALRERGPGGERTSAQRNAESDAVGCR